MSARLKPLIMLAISIGLLATGYSAFAMTTHIMTDESIANQLGWVSSDDTKCGGYYLEQPFNYVDDSKKSSSVQVTGSQALFSQHGTTVLEGEVSVMRFGQQITANKAFIYRDATTGKITAMDLLGNVHLREPNTLIIAKQGRYEFQSRNKALQDILYRTSLGAVKNASTPKIADAAIQTSRKVEGLTAWGKADEFSQNEPKIYELNNSSFSTCPPLHPSWRVRASHIVLNKNIGRGYATNARIYVKDIPVLYIPYFSFSLDHQRKSGFLWPTVGNKTVNLTSYNGWGPFVFAPFYWNMAPNFDMTITPAWLGKRGNRLTDKFRYLSTIGQGSLQFGVLPNDTLYQTFKQYAQTTYGNSTNDAIQADLNRLETSSNTRKSFSWHDDSIFSQHWSSHIDFNYAGDDYYVRNFGGDLNEVTQNQLLQEGDLYYKGQNWNFIGRLQAYETMHPVDENPVQNQYRRFPQLLLTAHYPDQAFGLEYFLETEATHFDIRNTPGTIANQPVGNRFHLQPGVSLPLYWPYFFINPRMQVSMTGYNLNQTLETNAPDSAKRTIPIFDMAMGMAFNRDMTLFNHNYLQTLEPQLYYDYIPYRNQASIPIFDTTVNTLTYDQIFNYNRFSSVDRIGDANQLGFGLSSRILDADSGFEKIRIGVGDIVYFSNRKVTFCNNTTCNDNPFNPANHWRLSPISGLLNYNVNPSWSLNANALVNPISKQLSNSSIGVHYQPDERRLINLNYGYVNGSDPLSGGVTSGSANNLKLSDFSFVWPASESISVVGRWSENWNQMHLQNLIYGLQYDTCCWAMRAVGNRAFSNLNASQNSSAQYTNEFYIQFSLKGLGEIGNGNPSGLLSSISGYTPQFGQEI